MSDRLLTIGELARRWQRLARRKLAELDDQT
jgi:hypothetical protein